MTESEREAVETLQRMHPHWQTEAGARDQCNIASDQLIERVPGAQRLWVDNDCEPRHCVVLMPSGAVVDLTAAQFGTPDEYADLDAVLATWVRYRISEVHWTGATEWVYREGVEPKVYDGPPPRLASPGHRPGVFPRP